MGSKGAPVHRGGGTRSDLPFWDVHGLGGVRWGKGGHGVGPKGCRWKLRDRAG